jgi:aspartate/methionine/tyrosine aminotransferase
MRVSSLVAAVSDPPVAEAKAWVAGRTFGPERPLVDVSQAVPSYPPAIELREHLADVVRADDTASYAPVVGLARTRAAVARHLRAAYATEIDAIDGDEHVLVTAGCNQSFCLAIGALCEPGDEVVLPRPWYFNHEMWLRANGVGVVTLPLDATRGMVPEPYAVAAAITPRTRAIVLVTPNNPCGVVYPPAVIEACFDIARDAGVALVLDETYKDFRPSTDPPHALFRRADWPDTLVHLFSFSKVFSLAGYRCGSLVARPDVLRAAAKLADCETIGAPRIAQVAVEFAIDHLGNWVEARRREMSDRLDRFASELAAAGTGYETVAAGSFFAYLRHPFAGEPARAVAQRLADAHDLLTIPGECFGPQQEHFLRLAFGNVVADHMPLVAQRLAESSR